MIIPKFYNTIIIISNNIQKGYFFIGVEWAVKKVVTRSFNIVTAVKMFKFIRSHINSNISNENTLFNQQKLYKSIKNL